MAAGKGRIRVEQGHKHVRAYLGGEAVADSKNVLLVWEKPYYPTYYFPLSDVNQDALVATGETKRSPSRGEAQLFTVKAGGKAAENAAYRHAESPIEELRDHVAFTWSAMDHWFEENEEVFVHARDPYSRIDILDSSRHIRVEIDGVTVAETNNAKLLFETGLPVRYYLPKPDVRFDLLTPTDLVTECPYKGKAQYWNVHVNGVLHENVVWGYDFPLPESQKIQGLVSFYNEKLNIYVDGELETRPKTMFS
jgi:uncharacterized protein (DUF427 family)